MIPEEPTKWNERTVKFRYPAGLRDMYRKGNLFRQWYEQYKEEHFLFDERMLKSRQLPCDGPVKDAIGFHELFAGMRYLDAGYDALWYYRDKAREKAKELLGGDAAVTKLITNLESHPQPPDLLVFCPKTKRFRFV